MYSYQRSLTHTHTFNALKQIIMLISSFQSSSSLLVAQWMCFEKTHHLQRAALQIRTFVPKWLLCAFVSRQKVCQRLLCLSLIIVWHLLFWIWREWKCYHFEQAGYLLGIRSFIFNRSNKGNTKWFSDQNFKQAFKFFTIFQHFYSMLTK